MRRSAGPRGGVLPLPEGDPRWTAGLVRPPVVRTRRRPRLPWRRALVLLVAAYCAAVARTDVATYLGVRRELAALAAQETALRQREAALRSAIAYAQTDAYVAAAARQEFGMVAPDQEALAPLYPASQPERVAHHGS